MERLDEDTLVPPSQAGVEIPLYLERVILKGLAVQPEDRFQTAGEFLKALENQRAVEQPEVGMARQVSQEAAPSGKKKPIPLWAGGAAAVLAAVVFIGLFLGGRREEPFDGGAASQGQSVLTENPGTPPGEMVNIGGRDYSTSLTSLDLRELGLGDEELQGLEKMTNLTELDLRGNEMTDLSPLMGLSHLKVLHLPAANIEDLSPLSGLTQLEDLALIDPSSDRGLVEDITPLSSLVNLKELYLKVGVISDLTPLSGMTKLESLRIRGENYVTDYSPLSGMKDLKELEMPENQFHQAVDISPFSGLTSLESLRMGCNVRDLEPLRGLSSLKSLRLTGRTSGSGDDIFSTLEPLSSLTGLVELELQSDVISDLSPLAGLTNLKSLDLTVPQATDLSPLLGLPNLEKAEVNGEKVAR